MSNYNLLQKANYFLILVVISLSVIALISEVLPETEAKVIVIPTLIMTIILCIFEINRLRIKKNS